MSSFNDAFAKARGAGRKTFAWNGKTYTTELKKDADLPKSAPLPPSRPAQAGDPAPASPPSRPADAPKADAAAANTTQANNVTSKSVADANDEVRKAKEKHAEAIKRLAR